MGRTHHGDVADCRRRVRALRPDVVGALERTSLCGARQRARLRYAALGCVAVLAAAVATGCQDKKGQVSSAEFLTVEPAGGPGGAGFRQLTTQLELLKTISPSVLAEELENQTALTTPFGKLTERRLLLFESLRGALVSVDLCPECSQTGGRSRAAMHYDRDGFEEELLDLGAVGATVSLRVPPAEVVFGGKRWIIVFEESTRSLIALHYEPSFRAVRPELEDRDPNFGRGNGLIVNVVISGQEIQRQIGAASSPVTRVAPFGEGDPRLLVFFSTASSIRAVHLLELSLDTKELDPDLGDGSTQRVPVEVLRGNFRTFPNPDPQLPPAGFLSFDAIQEVTQRTVVAVDAFAPVVLPDGSLLLFDEASGAFLKVRDPGPASRGAVEVAVPPARLRDLVVGASLRMTEAWMREGEESVIYVVEEQSNTILRYDSESGEVSAFIPAERMLIRRDPTLPPRTAAPVGGEEPILRIARNDIRENRLAFDLGRDELLALSYDSGVAVIVAKRADFLASTGRELAEFRYMEKVGEIGGDEDVRAWDSVSSSLLEVRLRHRTLPVLQVER